mmetsp:Transcript_6467/g.9328  ORF Transcript_6467/g.9328 Transcript_6467/m.9328 type:complete len:554 (-) Transcript_6467:103-1764(-)
MEIGTKQVMMRLMRLIQPAVLIISTTALIAPCPQTRLSSSLGMTKSVVVVSPPGGVGEVAVVKAAEMGSAVRWFVVQSNTMKSSVSFSQDTLDTIEQAGGKVELAGADTQSLLEDPDALSAVGTWCGSADSLLCADDGIQIVTEDENQKLNEEQQWRDALKLASQQAGKSITGRKVAIVDAAADEDEDITAEQKKSPELFGFVFGGSEQSNIPKTISAALGGQVTKLRHGKLFGTPESSPDFSAFVGGPQKNPIICEEYTRRTVRIDPTLSITGNQMMGASTESCRHAVGEAAALILLDKVQAENGIDVCVSSYTGNQPFSLELWQEEFRRVDQMLLSGEEALLFSAAFSSVPDTNRLASWIATKWAPAVLRTYDIAAIRIGARPVYASLVSDNSVEIVWQQLVDFESVVAGKMRIDVKNDGITATRLGGDASKGFGATSRTPLNGESVLVRRLGEAASQAIEKGLANKVFQTNDVPATPSIEPTPKKQEPVVPPPVPSAAAEPPVTPVIDESGPRQTGARRSAERARGSRQRKRVDATTTPEESKADENAFQ